MYSSLKQERKYIKLKEKNLLSSLKCQNFKRKKKERKKITIKENFLSLNIKMKQKERSPPIVQPKCSGNTSKKKSFPLSIPKSSRKKKGSLLRSVPTPKKKKNPSLDPHM